MDARAQLVADLERYKAAGDTHGMTVTSLALRQLDERRRALPTLPSKANKP